MIFATAGHVDHGKTTLVRALTGQDTDRLPEEKQRGMSIDLGFAYLPNESGEPIAFIDVPGHERFIRNMASGVFGIDAALLVIAADDGPMPQTLEHLQILQLLGVKRLIAVLTKIDRVSTERLIQVEGESRHLLAGTFFKDAPLFPISLVSGRGIEALRARLMLEARTPKSRYGERYRMNVDRAFIIDGLGLVATGTVLSGAIEVGSEVVVLPHGRRSRVRSLHANHGPAGLARAGHRCALALVGLGRQDAQRGDIIVAPGPVPSSRHIDVALEPLPGIRGALLRRRQVDVHIGTVMLPATLFPITQDQLGRLYFAREVNTWNGDRLLLRDPGVRRLLGAATVVDAQPPLRGATRGARVAFLERIAGLSAVKALDAVIDGDSLLDLDWFASCWNLSSSETEALAARHPTVALTVKSVPHLIHQSKWKTLCINLVSAIADWHLAHPEKIGPRPSDLTAAIGAVPREVVLCVVQALIETGRLVRQGRNLRLPSHQPKLSSKDEKLWRQAAPMLEGSRGRPPTVSELADALAIELKVVADFLDRCSQAGRVCRVAPNRFFLPDALDRLLELALALHHESGGLGFRAAVFRDRSALGRNLTIQVLEFLDSSGYTELVGELRKVRYLEETRPRWGARTSNPERGA